MLNPVTIVDANGVALTLSANGEVQLVGNVASGATDSGNPVKVGGIGASSAPTAVDANDRVNAWFGLNGQLMTSLVESVGGAKIATLQGNSDAVGVSSILLGFGGFNLVYNGSAWERVRSAVEGQVLASAARTAAVAATLGPVSNYNPNAALHLYVNVTANGGAFGLTPAIYARDPVATSVFHVLLTGTKITSTGAYIFSVGRGITASAGRAAGDMLPRNWGYGFAVDDATSVTYSVGYAIG